MTMTASGAEIVTIPCLADNYAFLLHDPATRVTACFDVPDAGPVRAMLEDRGWRLSTILITHHHADHVAGVAALVAATGARVAGSGADAHRLPPLDTRLAPGDRLAIGVLEAEVLDVSGHCDNHLAFHVAAAGAVFCGDSLMALGCGRLFEGTPAQMWESLSRLAALPPATLVCSGHEYTAGNARFALSIDPGNAALVVRAEAVAAARAQGVPTVPSILDEELATNPFLRAADPVLARALGLEGADPVRVFAEIRARKDRF